MTLRLLSNGISCIISELPRDVQVNRTAAGGLGFSVTGTGPVVIIDVEECVLLFVRLAPGLTAMLTEGRLLRMSVLWPGTSSLRLTASKSTILRLTKSTLSCMPVWGGQDRLLIYSPIAPAINTPRLRSNSVGGSQLSLDQSIKGMVSVVIGSRHRRHVHKVSLMEADVP